MRSVKRFGYTILLAILAGTECICVLWLLALCGSTYEAVSSGMIGGSYLGALASTGDFWRALIFFLLSSFALTGVSLLLRRERQKRRAELEGQKICENETEWEAQP